MACESRVVIIRDKQRRIKDMQLVCEGVCTGGRCRKIEADHRDATNQELFDLHIIRDVDRKYRTYVQKCACKDGEGNVREQRGEVQHCCQIVIREYIEWHIVDPPAMSSYRIVKRIIQCEKREGGDCAECKCERFKVKDSVHEIVDENGEVIGTAESVVCKCL